MGPRVLREECSIKYAPAELDAACQPEFPGERFKFRPVAALADYPVANIESLSDQHRDGSEGIPVPLFRHQAAHGENRDRLPGFVAEWSIGELLENQTLRQDYDAICWTTKFRYLSAREARVDEDAGC